jgi:dsRNA-specific ribonuclease
MEFREKIRQVLELSGLKKRFIDKITDKDGMELYRQAFTHESVDPVNNYQWLEILGDVTLNKCIVWYINSRFPQLHNKEGVKVIARLKINLVSKKHFSEIARRLGFLPFIRCDPLNNNGKPCLENDMLEDTLEAFFGATEMLIDNTVSVGAGYGICYHLIKNILDPEPISLRYEDLFDAVTRLKELSDSNKTLGQINYIAVKTENGQLVRVFSNWNKNSQKGIFLAEAIAPSKYEGQQIAATRALELLAQRGIQKPVDPYYLSLVQ